MATTLLAAAAKSSTGMDSAVSRTIRHLPEIRTNLSSTERWLSLAAGGVLSTLGFTGRGASTCSALTGGYLFFRAATGNCLLYQALGVSTSDTTNPNGVIAATHGTRVDHAMTVRKPVDEVYWYWRDFENLPRFMTHLLDVETTSDGKSRWRARGPLGLTFEWDAELIVDAPGRLIAWKSVDGSDVDTAGAVHFRELPGDRGTEVRVSLKYDPPLGKAGRAVASLLGKSPAKQIREDMRHFKQLLEAGEIATTDGQPHGKR